ncbi:MAG TPA: N-acyl homoserine lactonase family protein [Ktedonobacteraceae bacterium]|nr:N-acyl homoserine lactonase family protein [Ktedonobacteraceae bacterium]
MTMADLTPLRLYFMLVVPEPDWPVGCYLVQTKDGKNVLIDSGLPFSEDEPGDPPSVWGKNVVEQLADIGLQPKDIDMVICTHYDQDHVGFHREFTEAEFVVQRKHHEAALSGLKRFAGSRENWDQPGRKYRLVEGDVELFPGLHLVDTSGHVPGHQSVLIHLPETGVVLLAIDAVTRKKFWRADRETGPMDMDKDGTIASTRKLMDLADREKVVLVVCGHDSDGWKALKTLPEYYG